jgi:hypothetical protein
MREGRHVPRLLQEEVGRNFKSSMRRIPVGTHPEQSRDCVVQPFFLISLSVPYLRYLLTIFIFLRGPTGSRPVVILF